MNFEDPRESKKCCPIDGHRIGPAEAECFNYDCTERSADKYYILHGHRCYCEVRRWEIEQWHKKRVESARKYKKMEASQQIASEISIDDFYSYCDDIDKEMIATKQKYVPDMSINLYHAEDERCLVYLFSGDELVDTGIVTNPFSFLSARFDKITDPDFDAAINICAVPASIAEAVNVRVRLIRNMDVTPILHHDNPVYIKSRGISARDVQEYLNLASVQSVYNWCSGINMPTIDNLYAISQLFQMPIDAIVRDNRRPLFYTTGTMTDTSWVYKMQGE